MYAILILCLVILLDVSSCQEECDADKDKEWSYHYPDTDPSNWGTLFADNCGGKRQSPIDIDTSSAPSVGTSVSIDYDDAIESATMENTGSTIMITPTDDIVRPVTFYGVEYNLQQIHFHWGSGDSPGSEHSINGMRYDMEVHFVHYYSDSDRESYANLALFIKADGSSNPDFQTISDAVGSVKFDGDSTEIGDWDFRKLLPESGEEVYVYGGSRTTPPCQGPVSWFVFPEPIVISAEQFAPFHEIYTVKDEDPNCKMDGNFRPTQSNVLDVSEITLF